jgi:gentisate 1,2-dioxygenase
MPSERADIGSLDELDHRLRQIGMTAGWNRPPRQNPEAAFRPHHWRYAQAKAALDAAGALISTEVAERRNLILVNPAAEHTRAAARTMMAAYQMVMPGERTRAHRHTPSALRLVLDAEPGAYTIVDGEMIPMLAGDVVLTPNWCWHSHVNEGLRCAYWLDFLDVPLVHLLDLRSFEEHPRDLAERPVLSPASPMRFAWHDTEQRLTEQAGEIELGKPALETMALFMRRLPAGASIACDATAFHNLHAVVCGHGITEVGGEQFAWGRGDVLVIPAHHAWTCHAIDDAILFRVTDAPAMQKLGLSERRFARAGAG